MWQWNAQPGNVTQLTPDVQQILQGVIDARLGWQPTMQVIYGFRDLFDPQYLSDTTLARVLPADLIEWYRSAEGRSFRDRMAQGLPKEVTTGDEVARWTAIQAMYAESIARNESAARYLADRNARILFGTDTPAAPIYTNPPGLNGWLEMRRLVAGGLTAHQVFVAATLANATALGLADEIGTVEAGKRANLKVGALEVTVLMLGQPDAKRAGRTVATVRSVTDSGTRIVGARFACATSWRCNTYSE